MALCVFHSFRAVTNLMRNQGFSSLVGLQPLGRARCKPRPKGPTSENTWEYKVYQFIIVNLKVNLTWQRSMAKQQWQQSAEPSAGLWLLGKCHSQRWVGLVGEWPAAQASVRCLKLGSAIPAVWHLTHLLTGKWICLSWIHGPVQSSYVYIYIYVHASKSFIGNLCVESAPT